jgi:predicted ABC-type transport system involved in lysophospholipase L1 biosynthesis ATPase subunit
MSEAAAAPGGSGPVDSATPGAGANRPLLRAARVGKTYWLGQRSLEVLCGVNLEVNRGDFLALRGASGAGKSTLLHLLGGLDAPTGGEIWFEERNLAALSARELARFRNRKIGFVFQSYFLFPELDALENVCLPARVARSDPARTRKRAGDLLDRVGLGGRLDHRPGELSGGEQQRVAIARALINEPDLVLADEPTGNLDSHTGAGIIDLLCALRLERGATLMIATHDATVASRAPRVVELVDGRIAAESAIAETK